MGIGFDLLFGWTGLLSFGQAAFFGTGGFVAAYLLVYHVISSVWLALAIGTIAAGVFGMLVGWLAVRRIGIYFAMITLAFGQMSFFLENSPLSAYTGGENGTAWRAGPEARVRRLCHNRSRRPADVLDAGGVFFAASCWRGASHIRRSA